MDGGGWEARVVEVIIQIVDSGLVVREDQGTNRNHAKKQVKNGTFLGPVLHKVDLNDQRGQMKEGLSRSNYLRPEKH